MHSSGYQLLHPTPGQLLSMQASYQQQTVLSYDNFQFENFAFAFLFSFSALYRLLLVHCTGWRGSIAQKVTVVGRWGKAISKISPIKRSDICSKTFFLTSSLGNSTNSLPFYLKRSPKTNRVRPSLKYLVIWF